MTIDQLARKFCRETCADRRVWSCFVDVDKIWPFDETTQKQRECVAWSLWESGFKKDAKEYMRIKADYHSVGGRCL